MTIFVALNMRWRCRFQTVSEGETHLVSSNPRRGRWRRWLLTPSPYPRRVQIISTTIFLAWVCAWVGIPYAFGVTWPWRYGRLTGPVLILVLWLPMAWWLRRHGYYDEERRRRFHDDE